MANNWRYYQATGQAGGTTALQYVDSFNGDDANSGSYDAPKQSIQGALDAGSNNMTLVLAGYFNEGDWINIRSNLNLYSEGLVNINGLGFLSFNLGESGFSGNGGINSLYRFGTLVISNYAGFVNVRSSSSVASQNICVRQNIVFINCPILQLVVLNNQQVGQFINCVFINCDVFHVNQSGTHTQGNGLYNCTFINTNYMLGYTLSMIDCFFDSNSSVNFLTRNPYEFDFNCILGTAGNGQKIQIGSVWYENTEDLQANTSFAVNDLPSTTDPEFNLINDMDYTLQPSSPLARAGKGNIHIGAYSVAKATPSNDGTWTATGIDNTTDPNQAVLTGSPTGTLESGLIEIADKVRRVTRINMPDFKIAPSLGETIGRLASDRTPYNVSVEIQYSVDGVTTNGTWLQVPVGTQPFHDTVNDVGNDHEDFDMANATAIFASHLQYRITMRDNEVQV